MVQYKPTVALDGRIGCLQNEKYAQDNSGIAHADPLGLRGAGVFGALLL